MDEMPEEVLKGLEDITQEVTQKCKRVNGEAHAQTIMDFLKEEILLNHYPLGESIDDEEKHGVRTLMVLYIHALNTVDGDFTKFQKCYGISTEPREKAIRDFYSQAQNRGSVIYDLPISKRYKVEVEVAKATRWIAKSLSKQKG